MIKTDKNLCTRCGGCVGVCPVSALTLSEHGLECNEKCTDCGICINFCPMKAIEKGEQD